VYKYYEVEYEIRGSYIDTVYDVDNEQEAMDKAIADLRDSPLVITKDDVTFTLVTEIDYEFGGLHVMRRGPITRKEEQDAEGNSSV